MGSASPFQHMEIMQKQLPIIRPYTRKSDKMKENYMEKT
jgi:hypothetical protein